MRRLAHTTYLIGQLSKLAQSDNLLAYQRGTPSVGPLNSDVWQILKPWIAECETFAQPSFVEAMLSALDETALKMLSYHFSTYHGNGVHAVISQHEEWALQEFQLRVIQVQYVESELNSVIQRLEHRLLDLAQAAELLKHPNYKEKDVLVKVSYSILLGKWKRPASVRLIDGNHRAIHITRRWLALGGCLPSFSVVVPSRASRVQREP